jgi:ABC-type sugar transport system permease subunit
MRTTVRGRLLRARTFYGFLFTAPLLFLFAAFVIYPMVMGVWFALIEGASTTQNFWHVTFPLLRNLYLICTLLSMVFMLGDFTVPWLMTGGAPGTPTHVLATLAYATRSPWDGSSGAWPPSRWRCR